MTDHEFLYAVSQREQEYDDPDSDRHAENRDDRSALSHAEILECHKDQIFSFYFKKDIVENDYKIIIFDFDSTALINFNKTTFNIGKGFTMFENSSFKDYEALSDRLSSKFEGEKGHGWSIEKINNLTLFKTDLDIFMIYRHDMFKPIISERLKDELEKNCVGFYFREAIDLLWS